MRNMALFILVIVLFVSAATGERPDEIRSLQSEKVSSYEVWSKASVPRLLNYQGYLTDDVENPVTDTLEITFSIWDAATGGSQLWSETQASVSVVNGLFNVLLGSATPIPNIFTGAKLWLQTQVGTETLSPRKEIVSVGYAYYANKADTSGYSFSAYRADSADYATHASFADSSGIAQNATYSDSSGATGRATYSDIADISDSANVAGYAHDADMVDGQHADAFADATHQHDDRYYTQQSLNTSDGDSPNVGSNVVHWDNLWGVPTGFADGIDDVGSPGSGISQIIGGIGISVTDSFGPTTTIAVEVPLELTESVEHPNAVISATNTSSSGYGVYGENENGGNSGYLGGSECGTYGQNSNGNYGVFADSSCGAYGQHNNGNKGSLGSSNFGVFGEHSSGNYGCIGSDKLAVYGYNSNGNYGSFGDSSNGVYGENNNGNKGALGNLNQGVYGENSNGNYGYLGDSSSGAYAQHNNGNRGILGNSNFGAFGEHSSGNYGFIGSDELAVYGRNSNGNYGSFGDSNSGAYGQHSNGNKGALGTSHSGAHGENSNGNYGFLGSADVGAYGRNNNGNYGSLGDANYAVYGRHNNGNYGFFGYSDCGARAFHNNGNEGSLGTNNYGVYGHHNNGNYGYIGGAAAVYGRNSNGNFGNIGGSNNGVYGEHESGNKGGLGAPGVGVYGNNSNGNRGSLGDSNNGVYGEHDNGNRGSLGNKDFGAFGADSSGNYGYLGSSQVGAYGQNSNGNYGNLGDDSCGVYGKNQGSGNYGSLGGDFCGVLGATKNEHNCGVRGTYYYSDNEEAEGMLGAPGIGVYGKGLQLSVAGYFDGFVEITENLQVFGTISKGGGEFKIDHPLDPENMYLHHSFVESPDMKNVYDGVVILDENGEATVVLPDWFEALNRDFRYQLTCIGNFAPVYIVEEIADNRFKIGGGNPGMKVSWQVTGIRQDPYANAHRIPVEDEKPPEERGYYLHPDVYGQPEEKSIEWARRPEMMHRMKEKTGPSLKK